MRNLAENQAKSGLKMVDVNCNYCGSSSRSLVTAGTDLDYGITDDVFSVCKCLDCGLVYLSPRPDISELPKLYPPHYAPYNVEDGYDAGSKQTFYYKLLYGAIRLFVDFWLERLLPNTKNISVLDIGCADGHALNCMRHSEKKKVETFGVDISEIGIEKARANGHTAYLGRFEDIDLPHASFDLVYAGHVIEHVSDPGAFIAKIKDVLKPGGVCILFTPNIGSIDARIFQDRLWGPYCLPRHWYFFDRNSLGKLATRAGLIVSAVAYIPTGSTWLYTMHSVFKGTPRLAHLAEKWFPLQGSMKINAFNIVSNFVFTATDLAIWCLTLQTSNMGIALRKP